MTRRPAARSSGDQAVPRAAGSATAGAATSTCSRSNPCLAHGWHSRNISETGSKKVSRSRAPSVSTRTRARCVLLLARVVEQPEHDAARREHAVEPRQVRRGQEHAHRLARSRSSVRSCRLPWPWAPAARPRLRRARSSQALPLLPARRRSRPCRCQVIGIAAGTYTRPSRFLDTASASP